MSKPREYWFYDSDEYRPDILPKDSGAKCFVEKSAYDAIAKELGVSKYGFDVVKKQMVLALNKRIEAEQELTAVKSAYDELRATLEKIRDNLGCLTMINNKKLLEYEIIDEVLKRHELGSKE